MIILRQKYYSSKKENDEEIKNKKSKRIGRIATAGAVGVGLGGELLGAHEVLKSGFMDNCIGGEDVADKIRGKLKIKKRVYTPEDADLFEKLHEKAKAKGVKLKGDLGFGPAYDNEKDRIVGLNSKKGADLFSHELGHRHYIKEKDAEFIGKAAHKIYMNSGDSLVSGYIIPNVSGVTSGVISGIRKAKKEDKGEKESVVNKHVSWVAPLITSAPMLISEAAASRKGIKYLKEQGASKEYLKEAKKHLGKAFGTYASKALVGSGVGLATKQLAYRTTKRRLQKEKEEKKERIKNDNTKTK